GDLLLEVARDLRVVGIVIVAVRRKLGIADLVHLEVLRRESNEGAGKFAVDRFRCQAADEVADLEAGHVVLRSASQTWVRRRRAQHPARCDVRATSGLVPYSPGRSP